MEKFISNFRGRLVDFRNVEKEVNKVILNDIDSAYSQQFNIAKNPEFNPVKLCVFLLTNVLPNVPAFQHCICQLCENCEIINI